MCNRRVLQVLACAVIPAVPAMAVTYEVGPGRTYPTIQAAVDAAAATEGTPGHVPQPTILIYGGVYNELVSIPFDPDFSSAGAGVNDGWTIKAAPGENVLLRGHMIFFFGRENFLIEDIVVDNTNTSNPGLFAGINFHGGTTRDNTVRNCVVYGVNNDGVFGNPAIRGNFTYGANTLDHVTIFNIDYGITANSDAHFIVKNSIVANANNYGIFSTPGSPSSVSYSNFFGNSPNYDGNITDAGNNVNYPAGSDPLFVSTNPANPYFLWLRPDSPMIGAGEMGSNLGGRPVFEPIWSGGAGSNWSTSANWVADFVPNSVGMTAKLPATAVARNISVDVPITVGRLTVDGAVPYTVSGPQPLTLQRSSGAAEINIVQGSHTISAPLTIASDTVLSGNGTLKIASISIDSGKALDMTDRSLVVDYTGASPRAALESLLASGYANGAHNGAGIRTSLGSATLSLGIAEAGSTPFGATYNGHALDSTSLIIRYTLAGDVNLSGVVDINDFAIVAANFNTPSRWSLGDVNYTGMTDISDFALLASNFNRSIADLPRATVPEPAAAGALVYVALLLRQRR